MPGNVVEDFEPEVNTHERMAEIGMQIQGTKEGLQGANRCRRNTT